MIIPATYVNSLLANFFNNEMPVSLTIVDCYLYHNNNNNNNNNYYYNNNNDNKVLKSAFYKVWKSQCFLQ